MTSSDEVKSLQKILKENEIYKKAYEENKILRAENKKLDKAITLIIKSLMVKKEACHLCTHAKIDQFGNCIYLGKCSLQEIKEYWIGKNEY